MNFKHLYRILPFVFVLLWASCSKDNDSTNKFQCRIDGVSWFYKPLEAWDSRVSVQMLYTDNKKSAYFIGEGTGASLRFAIHDADSIKVGNYSLNNRNVASIVKDGVFYSTDEQHTGKLTIKQIIGSTSLQFAEATFSFDAYNSESQKVLKVTEGYLRINY